MNVYEMLKLVPHPTVENAYTFAHAERGYRIYKIPAQTYFFEKVIDNEFFFIKSTVIVQKDDRIVNSYYMPKNTWKFYSFKNILHEMKKYYGMELPEPDRIKYFDYTRLHAVYDDGTTVKIGNRQLYRLRPHPLADETGLNIYYVTEGTTYATITGAEVIELNNNGISLRIGYTKILDLTPELLSELVKIKNPKKLASIVHMI